MNDLFLKIVSGEIPSHKVYENEHVYAFLDIQPVHHGHTLVIPKKQYRNVLDIPEDVWVEMMKAVRIIARAVKEATKADGINLIMNNEPAGHQVVFHAHMHVIPRFENDGLKTWPQEQYADGEASVVAEKIKNALV